MHNAVSRTYPLQPGPKYGTTWSLLINNVNVDHTANNDNFFSHCSTEQYKQQTKDQHILAIVGLGVRKALGLDVLYMVANGWRHVAGRPTSAKAVVHVPAQ